VPSFGTFNGTMGGETTEVCFCLFTMHITSDAEDGGENRVCVMRGNEVELAVILCHPVFWKVGPT